MIILPRMAAPALWRFAFEHLPEILLGIRWDEVSDCFEGDIDGAVYRMYLSDPWAMIFETGRRTDLVDWLASRKQLPRQEVVRALQAARGQLELPERIGGDADRGPSLEAMQYAEGRG